MKSFLTFLATASTTTLAILLTTFLTTLPVILPVTLFSTNAVHAATTNTSTQTSVLPATVLISQGRLVSQRMCNPRLKIEVYGDEQNFCIVRKKRVGSSDRVSIICESGSFDENSYRVLCPDITLESGMTVE